jgi:hypothetical protein
MREMCDGCKRAIEGEPDEHNWVCYDCTKKSGGFCREGYHFEWAPGAEEKWRKRQDARRKRKENHESESGKEPGGFGTGGSSGLDGRGSVQHEPPSAQGEEAAMEQSDAVAAGGAQEDVDGGDSAEEIR